MDYRCHVRKMLRTVGCLAGLCVAVTPALAAKTAKIDRSESAQLQSLEDVVRGRVNEIMVVAGGDAEFQPEPGPRADPCTLGGTNTYDRAPGMAPYPFAIAGQFNFQEFYVADDFVPAANDRVNRLCLRGLWSDVSCATPTDPLQTGPSPSLWTVNFYTVNLANGLPSAPLGSFNSGSGGGLTVTQGRTGLPVGINPNDIEMGFFFSLDQGGGFPAINVTAGTCYFAEFFTNPTCPGFYLQGYSYERVEGNRSSLRRDNVDFPVFTFLHLVNLDMNFSVGFVGGSALVNSNVAACGNRSTPFPRLVPTNDTIATPVVRACNQAGFVFDNTYATHSTVLDPFGCRKSTVDLVDYTAGDVWFSNTPTGQASASYSLCSSDQLASLAGGDALMSVFRRTNIANPYDETNVTQVGCSDDACTGGLSQVDLNNLASFPNGGANQELRIRVASFDATDQGEYTFNVNCPTPTPANDIPCSATVGRGGTPVPANPGGAPGTGYATSLGIGFTGQTRTATIDGGVRGCGGAAIDRPDGGIAHTSRGVWFTLVGRGNVVLVTTDIIITGAAFDNAIAVYCGTCVNDAAVQPTLSCVASKDDKSDTVFQGEFQFCAANNRTYFIWLGGIGTLSGDFGISFRELRDGGNQPIPCCTGQVCGEACDFTLPINNRAEGGENTTGGLVPGLVENCVSNMGYTNTTQFNDGCSLTPPVGEDRRYDVFANLGDTVSGTIWASGQQRDRDYFLYENMGAGIPSNPNARSFVTYTFNSRGPLQVRFWTFNSLVNFQACNPFLGLADGSIVGCTGGFSRTFIATNEPVSQLGATPGRTLGLTVFTASTGGDGYPCGVNDAYFLTLDEVVTLDSCAVLNTTGATDETTLPTFDGTAGDDGVNPDGGTVGEPCVDPLPDGSFPPLPAVQFNRKAGCFASVITLGEFLTHPLNTDVSGRLGGTASLQSVTRDIDMNRFNLPAGLFSATLNVRASGPMTALITDSNCGDDQTTHAIAATRGTCIVGPADASDTVVLQGGADYLCWIFMTDSFGGNGGTIFANYKCDDAPSRYVVRVDVAALPDCSATPVCVAPVFTENEPCTTVLEEYFRSCDNVNENDGCSASRFTADSIAAGASPTCGSLFGVYDDENLDSNRFAEEAFYMDEDYYTFTIPVGQPSKVTFSARADGPVRVQLVDTGAPSGVVGSANEFGGSNCYNTDDPERIITAIDARRCSTVGFSQGVAYLAPGTYSLVVAPGTVVDGLSTSDLRCNRGNLNYSIVLNSIEPVGRCCVTTPNAVPTGLDRECVVVTATECTALGGIGFTAGADCSTGGGANTYSLGALMPHTLTPVSGAIDITSLISDDGVVTANEGGFTSITNVTLFGRSYGPTDWAVAANGYVVFGTAIDEQGTLPARAFGNTATPNAVIAPFWHDWDPTAPGAQVLVLPDTTPSGTTVIEWRNVADIADRRDRATFQLRINRAAGTFTYCYGTFTGLNKFDISSGDGDPIESFVGLEDETGLNGRNFAVTSGFLNGSQKIDISIADNACRTVVPPCCIGNADKVSPGNVAFSDITAILNNFNLPVNPNGTSIGDANCDGAVNFADVTAVLNNFTNPCP